jgi:hypothetical protein
MEKQKKRPKTDLKSLLAKLLERSRGARVFEEYSVLHAGDCLITVEYCAHCQYHDDFTQHKPERCVSCSMCVAVSGCGPCFCVCCSCFSCCSCCFAVSEYARIASITMTSRSTSRRGGLVAVVVLVDVVVLVFLLYSLVHSCMCIALCA